MTNLIGTNGCFLLEVKRSSLPSVPHSTSTQVNSLSVLNRELFSRSIVPLNHRRVTRWPDLWDTVTSACWPRHVTWHTEDLDLCLEKWREAGPLCGDMERSWIFVWRHEEKLDLCVETWRKAWPLGWDIERSWTFVWRHGEKLDLWVETLREAGALYGDMEKSSTFGWRHGEQLDLCLETWREAGPLCRDAESDWTFVYRQGENLNDYLETWRRARPLCGCRKCFSSNIERIHSTVDVSYFIPRS